MNLVNRLFSKDAKLEDAKKQSDTLVSRLESISTVSLALNQRSLTGHLSDLRILDFYTAEFPEATMGQDDGHAIGCYFALLLVKNCGFRLSTDDTSCCRIDRCVLIHEVASFIFFPWQTLIQYNENTGGASPCVSLWIDTIRLHNESGKHVCSSWHPIFKMAYNFDGSWPVDVASLSGEIVNNRPDLLHILADAIEWNDQTPIDVVRSRLREVL
jgi:hypothetical protein